MDEKDPGTIFDIVFPDLSDAHKAIAKAAIEGRLVAQRRERMILQIAGFPPEAIWRIDALMAANGAAADGMASRAHGPEAVYETIETHIETVKATATAMVAGRLAEPDECDCHVCQLRRRFDAGEVDPADLDRLLAQAVEKDAAEAGVDVPQYLTEKDLSHATSQPSQQTPWGYGMEHSEQVRSGAHPVPGGQADGGRSGGDSSAG